MSWSIEKVREVATTATAKTLRVDGSAILLDASSANAAVLVFDSLNADNQRKALSMPLARFVAYAWTRVKF